MLPITANETASMTFGMYPTGPQVGHGLQLQSLWIIPTAALQLQSRWIIPAAAVS